MFLTCLIAVAVTTMTEVEEFFPLETGRTWTYSDNGATTEGGQDRVGNQQDVGGHPATPIVTVVDGKVDGSTFYRVDGDQVLVVAFEQNNPLASPYPILVLSKSKNSWQHSGTTQWLGAPAPMSIKGSTKRTGKKELFGESRDTIQVTLEAVIGDEKGINLKSKQVSTYARGIGLVEMTDRTTMNRKNMDRKRTLLAFTAGSGG